MNYVNEPARQIPVKDKVDVLIIGSGPAGFAAAVCAGRCGVKTMLIEQCASVGGTATTGLMSHWTGNTQGGIYEEIIKRSSDKEAYNEQVINTEKLKMVLLEMLLEADVRLKLYTFACAPIMEGNRITGVIVESKSGREAILSKIVIDASGDGDIAARAGVPFYKGRETDGKMQPMTLMFKIGGVDYGRAVFPGSFESNLEVPKGKIQTLAKQKLAFPAGHVLLYRTAQPGVATCNMTNCIDVDGTKADDLTRAELVCRSQIEPIIAFLKEYVPGYEQCFLLSTASLIGVRETRHFECAYRLTEQDILDAEQFEDWSVTKAHFNFDIHNINGAGLDDQGVQHKFSQTLGYTIPYRCFLPKHIRNLYLAGRNISGTHIAHSNFRAMPICANMGQAVGTAAALCVKQHVSPHDLNVKILQDHLKLQNVQR